jgi:hypothetical protein
MGNRRLEEFERDLVANVGDKAVRDIVNDFRNYQVGPSAGPAHKVRLEGVGVVQTGDDGVKHRPPNTSSGWSEPKSIDSWKPPGLSIMDAMLDQQDAIDRAARARELAEAARHLRELAEAEAKLAPKETQK